MEIFGKKIRLRPYVCSPNGGQPCESSKVNLYIHASSFCPARCSFCPGFRDRSKVDLEKLETVVRELHTKKAINRIAITGGEPLVDLNSLNDILSAIESGGGSGYHISVNTNGINLPKLREMKKFSLLQDIHISRHSENDAENRRIFGIKVPTADQIKREIEQGPNIFSLSCNLLRGVIDSASRVRVYLDAAIDMGTNQVGFVSLMKKTDSCNSLFVDYEAIVSQFHVKDGFLFEEISRDRDSCKCENYRYFNDAGEIPIYLRRVLGGSKQDCVKAFIYGPDNLLVTNFGKDLVLA